MKTCQITFKSNKGLKFIKGEQYEVLPMIGEPRLKLFQVVHNSGKTFYTVEGYINKFFK